MPHDPGRTLGRATGLRRVRVLTLIDRLGPRGGAERLAVQIATRLDPQRFESHFCASRHDAVARADAGTAQARALLDEAAVAFVGIDRSSKFDSHKWARLIIYLRRHRIDVVHAHKHGSNVWGAVIARAAGVPVVVTHEHTWSWTGSPVRRLLDRRVVAPLTDAHIAVSRADQHRMTSVEGIPPHRTQFIPNGAFIPPRLKARADVRAELGIAKEVPVVGTVGFLRPQKALDVLVAAVPALRERFPEVQVLVVGEGEERSALEAGIERLGLSGTVRLLGRRLDVPDVLTALDVAVCCSDFEGSPLSVMEYMEAGRPVVAAAVGGVSDLVQDGVHGLLVPPRQPLALADAIARVLADPERAAAMGRAGQERRRAEFDIDTMVHRLESLYTRLVRCRVLED